MLALSEAISWIRANRSQESRDCQERRGKGREATLLVRLFATEKGRSIAGRTGELPNHCAAERACIRKRVQMT